MMRWIQWTSPLYLLPMLCGTAWAGVPSIEQVQHAAVRYIDCEPSTLRALERDARAYGALPEVQLEGSFDGDREMDLDAFDNVEGRSDAGGWQLSVELEWDLADLVTSYERIRTLSEQQRRMELRRKVLEDVTRCYFDRLRAVAEFELSPGLDPGARAALRLRIDELTAQLDAMTGGEFSRLAAADGDPTDLQPSSPK